MSDVLESTPANVAAMVTITLHRYAAMPCECPRPPNAANDRECVPCKARRAVDRRVAAS